MRLLSDANFSQRIVLMLDLLQLGCELVHSTQHLPQGASDPEVFELAKRLGAVLVTKDQKIMKRQHELAAFRSSGIGAFIFTGTAQRTLAEEAAFVLSVIANVLKTASHTRAPYVFRVTDLKRIEKLS